MIMMVTVIVAMLLVIIYVTAGAMKYTLNRRFLIIKPTLQGRIFFLQVMNKETNTKRFKKKKKKKSFLRQATREKQVVPKPDFNCPLNQSDRIREDN